MSDNHLLSLPNVAILAIRDSEYKECTDEAIRFCGNRVDFGHYPIIYVPQGAGEPYVSIAYLIGVPESIKTKASHVLVVQWDGFVVNADAWTDEFLEYDYIGAPWPDGVVGNCGFCLMSVKLLMCLSELGLKAEDCYPADVVLCRKLRPMLEAMGCRWAPRDLALRFSQEGGQYQGSFGFHGIDTLVDVVRKGLTSGKEWGGGLPSSQPGLVSFVMPQAAEDAMKLFRVGRFPEAETIFRAILDQAPDELEVGERYSEMLIRMGRPQDAVKYLAYAAAKEPYWGGRHIVLANCYNQLGDKVRAEHYYKEALRLGPQTPYFHWCYGMWLLGAGRLAEGFRQYRWGYHTTFRMKRHPQPEWDGTPIPGKTLYITCEQGLGDLVLYSRFINRIKTISQARVILECHNQLIDLFMPGRSPLPTGHEVVRMDEFRTFQTDFDEWISLPEMPLVCGVETWDDVTEFDPGNVWRQKIAAQSWRTEPHKRRIGLCWKGSAVNAIDRFRSLDISAFAPLADLDVEFINLQFGDTSVDFCGRPMTGVDISRTDLLAGVITSLDEVVTVDTFVANLAASMGIPTRVLVTTQSDWRWTHSGDRTPWFGSAILYRQDNTLDWSGPIQAIKKDIEETV